MKIIKILIIITIFAIIQMPLSQALAGISVAPDRHIVSLLPGEETVVKYQVYNSGSKDVNITIEPEAWSGIEDPYEWLTLEGDNAYVRAGESSPIVIGISAPEDAVGEMVAMLFLCYKDTSESQLNIRNGVPLYLIVKGTEVYDLYIDNIELTYIKNENNVNDLNVIVDIKNTGNVHIVPDVKVSIKNSEGKLLKEMSLTKPNIVLRNKAHTYRLGWRNPFFKDGEYTVTAVLDYEDKIEKISKQDRFRVSGNSIEMVIPIKEGN